MFKNANDTASREALYDIIIVFGMLRNLLKLIKTCGFYV